MLVNLLLGAGRMGVEHAGELEAVDLNPIETLLQDPGIDIVMPWFVFPDTPLEEDIVQKLGRLTRAYDMPILARAMGGPCTARLSKAIEAEGVPVFGWASDWIAATHAGLPGNEAARLTGRAAPRRGGGEAPRALRAGWRKWCGKRAPFR